MNAEEQVQSSLVLGTVLCIVSLLATAVASYLAQVFANSAIASFIVASSAIASSAIAGSILRAPPLRALDVQAALTGMVGSLSSEPVLNGAAPSFPSEISCWRSR